MDPPHGTLAQLQFVPSFVLAKRRRVSPKSPRPSGQSSGLAWLTIERLGQGILIANRMTTRQNGKPETQAENNDDPSGGESCSLCLVSREDYVL